MGCSVLLEVLFDWLVGMVLFAVGRLGRILLVMTLREGLHLKVLGLEGEAGGLPL